MVYLMHIISIISYFNSPVIYKGQETAPATLHDLVGILWSYGKELRLVAIITCVSDYH